MKPLGVSYQIVLLPWRQPEAAQNLWELRGSPDRGKQVRWARVNLMR
jgi:hypothetical protein